MFVKKLKSLIELVYNSSYKKPKPFTLTKEEQKDFESSVVCRLWEQEFYEDDDTAKMLKVRDHCILLVTTEELLITNAIFKGMILISLLNN